MSFRGAEGDEESRSALKILNTQGEILRCAKDDSEGLGMTVQTWFLRKTQSPALPGACWRIRVGASYRRRL